MRILVVDDHELVRRGICSVLATDPGITLCGEAADGQDAVEKATKLKPDIVVMDISMPRLTGLEATREIKRVLPGTGIVIVSQHEAPELVRQAFNAGALGYVVKSSIASDLLVAISKVKHQEPFVKRGASAGAASPDGSEVLKRNAAFEKALRESEERFRSAMNSIAEGLFILDTEGRATFVNPPAEAMLGWSSAELLGKKVHDIIHRLHEDGTPFPSSECPVLKIVQSGREVRDYEDVFVRKDGSLFPILTSVSPMEIAGDTVGLVVVFRDDTKRREAENVMWRDEKIYRAIAESIDYGVWITDASGQSIYQSPKFLRLVGKTQEECLKYGWAMVLHPDDIQATLEAWEETVRQGASWKCEQRFRRADGGWQHVLSRGVPIRNEFGKILYWAGINLDNQHRKETEIALEQSIAERTEELLNTRNELRGLSARLLKTQDEERRRIARELHDGVGQLLAAMSMNLATLLAERSALSEEASKSVDENRVLVDHALRDIRTMSYLLHPPLLDEIGLGSALRWYLEGFAERSKIAVTLDIAPNLGKLTRDIELSLFRIVQECLTNIHRHSGSPIARVRLYRKSGEIILEVTDAGKGMPLEVHQKVTAGEGYGLGFRGIQERLRQFGGTLRIETGESGTAVFAALPDAEAGAAEDPEDRVSDQLSATVEPVAEPVSNGHSATILCIDDEPAGMFARKLLLESAGHRVLQARSGPEGIRLFKSEKIDAVVLDYWMAGMKGTAVAAELKGIKPSVPIIVLSGLPEFPGEATGVVDEWMMKGNNRAEHLLDTVKTLLERRAI